MKKLLVIFSVLFLSLTAMMPVAGAVTLELGENILVEDGILDDAYVVAGNAVLDGDVFGDLYIASGQVSVNGQVHEDLVVAGGRVIVNGDVFGDLRVVGGQVAVYGRVGDDLVIAAGQADVGKDSVIEGSVITAAGVLTVDGVVKEDIRGGLGMLLLNGVVEKDVVVTIEDTINVADDAKIMGDLKYSALLEAKIPEKVVSGEILFNKFERETVLESLTYMFFIHKILSFVSALILALLLVIFTPRALVKVSNITRDNTLKSFGVGLLTMIVAIVGAILLMVTVVGVPLGLIVFALFVIVVYVTKVFVAAWFASHLLNFSKKLSRLKLFFGVAAGLLIYYVLGLIPYVGWLIHLVLFLIGVGALMMFKMENYEFLRKKKMI